MKVFPLFLSFILISFISQSQTPSPIAVAQMQLDAYNEQDIDAFAEVFAEDCVIYKNIGDDEPYLEGRRKIKKRYRELFKENPNNKSTLIGRMVQGNFVFDHEWITGREKEMKIMAIYEIENGLIQRAWFVR